MKRPTRKQYRVWIEEGSHGYWHGQTVYAEGYHIRDGMLVFFETYDFENATVNEHITYSKDTWKKLEYIDEEKT